MNEYEIDISKPVCCNLTGKFEALSQNWIHEDFDLLDFELFVVTSGSLFISYKNIKYVVNQGEYLLLHPSEAPNNRRKGYKPSDCSFYWMHFSPNYYVFNTNRNNINHPYLSFDNILLLPEQKPLAHPDKVIVLMKQLQDFVRSQYNTTSVNFMSTTILCEIFNQIYLKETCIIKKNYKNKQTYNDIVDFINENARINIKVSDISKHFGYNEKYLSHIFKSISGTNLKQYILHGKIEIANYLLTDTNKQIGEISYSIGFIDTHNFMKIYKKVTGLTPSEYRNAFSQRLLNHK